ncbi:MAG TPA: hypothetical protein VLF41_01075 [Candidatus Nanoarchaeia archaeon]|nr:hypothetical protein [Candidatus Nanoarchaeia archaeon]
MEPTTPAPGIPVSTTPSGFMSNPFAYIAPAWKALLLNLWTLIKPGLAAVGIFAVLGIITAVGLAAVRGSSQAGFNISLFVLGALAVLAVIALVILFIPYTIIIYLAGQRGQKLTFKEAFKECPKYSWRVLGGALLTGLAVIGGFILIIVPGFIFAAWFSLTSYIIVNENLGVVEAMKRSKALIKGHVVETWGLISIGSILGAIPIVNFVAGLISGQAVAARYFHLIELQKTGEKPPVHWANYLAIVLAIVAIPLNALTHPTVKNPPTTPSYNFNQSQ